MPFTIYRNPNWDEAFKKNKDISKDHGYQRFQFPDYTLDQIIREYHIFRNVIFDHLANNKLAHPTTIDLKVINAFIDNGIEEAAVEFVRLEVESSELAGKQNSLLETASDYIWLVDREHRYIYVNQALCDFWQLKREEVLGTTISDRFEDVKYAKKINSDVDECFKGNKIIEEAYYTTLETQTGFQHYILSPVLAKMGQLKQLAAFHAILQNKR